MPTVGIPGLQAGRSGPRCWEPWGPPPWSPCPRLPPVRWGDRLAGLWSLGPFQRLHSRVKSQFIDYRGPDNWKRLKGILGSFLATVPPEAEQNELLDHHPGGRVDLWTSFQSSCDSLQGRTMDSYWQTCELLSNFSKVNLLSPVMSPASQLSMPHRTAFRGYRSFQPGSPPSHPTFRGCLKVKAFYVQSPQ